MQYIIIYIQGDPQLTIHPSPHTPQYIRFVKMTWSAQQKTSSSAYNEGFFVRFQNLSISTLF